MIVFCVVLSIASNLTFAFIFSLVSSYTSYKNAEYNSLLNNDYVKGSYIILISKHR